MIKFRRVIGIAMLGVLGVLASPITMASGGPWKVECAQTGVVTTAIQAGRPFDVVGSGFHAVVLPIKVCVDGRGCQIATPNKDGSFLVTRSFTSPGVYRVEAWQARDMKITEWRLKATQQVAVNN